MSASPFGFAPSNSRLRRSVIDPVTGLPVATSAAADEARERPGDVVWRGSLLPIGRTRDGRVVPAGSEIGKGVVGLANSLPDIVPEGIKTIDTAGRMMRGEVPMHDEDGRPSLDAVGAAFGAAGLAMTGSLPFSVPAGSLRSFGGRRAATADVHALGRAEAMAAEGAGRQDIWDTTGWFQGSDRQWRFEIPDDTAAIGARARQAFDRDGVAMGSSPASVLNHAELYRAYPSLRGAGTAVEKSGTGGSAGSYNSGGIDAVAPDLDGVRSILLHELQHGIQEREGFALGADPKRVPFDAYSRSAGEVEARNVQARRDMTAAERRATPPWATQDVPDERQIVPLRDAGMVAAGAGALAAPGAAEAIPTSQGNPVMAAGLGSLTPENLARLLSSMPGPGPAAAPDAASFDDRFNQAPPGQGFGVDPKAVAPMRAGLLHQAPGLPVPLPAAEPSAPAADPQADRPMPGAVPAQIPFGAPRQAAPASASGPAPSAGQAPTALGAGLATPALASADGPSFGDKLMSGLKANGDYLGALGTGLLSTRGFGPGIGAGMQLAQAQDAKRSATDLAKAEYGLKVRKLAQEQQGNNLTLQRLVEKGVPAADAQAAIAASMAGHTEALTNLLSNTFRKIPDAPAGFDRNADGSMRRIVGGPQDPNVKREDAQVTAEGTAAGKGSDPFNLSPGQTRFDAAGNPLVSVPDRSKVLEQSGSIRKEIHTLPSYKNYSQALPVYQGMLETAGRDNKASDLNLIYGLGKIMDPGSVVREGELRLAQDTQGVADRLIGMYNGVMGGARLSPQARQQLLSEAFGRIQSYEQAFGQDRKGYEGIVSRQGMNIDDVLPNFAPVKPYQPPQRAQPSGPPSRADLEAEARRRRLMP